MDRLRIFSFLGLLAAALALIFSFTGIAAGSESLLVAIGLLLLAIGVVTNM